MKMNKNKLALIAALSVVGFVALIVLARISSLALAKSEVTTASEFGRRQTRRIDADYKMILRCYVDSYVAGKRIAYRYSAETGDANQDRRVLIVFDGPKETEYQVAYEIDVMKSKIERRIIVRLD